MNLERLEYIKSVSHPDGCWSYEKYRKGSYFPLNFHSGKGVETNAAKLPTGTLILLSQNYQGQRYLSHVVEIVNDVSEDKSQWDSSDCGIIRWVKVIWFAGPDKAPLDLEVIGVDWGWQNTKAKSLNSSGLKERWGSPDALRAHLSSVLVKNEQQQLAPA